MEKKIKESEKVLERKLVKWIKDIGGMSVKLKADYFAGLPDRMNLIPSGRIFFCELKTTGQKPTKLQELVHKQIRALGFKVYIVDSTDSMSEMLKTELLEKEKP